MRDLRKAVAKEDGAVLVLTVILLVVLLGMAALAIDVGQMLIAKQRAQNVCDAGALAGGRLLTGTVECEPRAEATAIDCKVANNDEVAPWQVNEFTVEFPGIDSPDGETVTYDDGTTATCEEGEAIRVRGRVHVDFAFAGLFGLPGLDIPADATALLTPAQHIYAPPLPLSVIEEDVANKQFDDNVVYGVIDSHQEGDIGPGNWMAVDFNQHGGGDPEFLARMRGTADPIPLSTDTWINTFTGSSVQQRTYDGLIGTFTGSWQLQVPGRILSEVGTLYSASGAPPDNWYTTGYNPTAWATWKTSQNPATGLYPYTSRIAILPVIENPNQGDSGTSDQVHIVGFVAFFIDRVYDGRTNLHDDPTQRLGRLGEIEGYFIQAIIGGGPMDNMSWIFEPGGDVGSSSIDTVRLIS